MNFNKKIKHKKMNFTKDIDRTLYRLNPKAEITSRGVDFINKILNNLLTNPVSTESIMSRFPNETKNFANLNIKEALKSFDFETKNKTYVLSPDYYIIGDTRDLRTKKAHLNFDVTYIMEKLHLNEINAVKIAAVLEYITTEILELAIDDNLITYDSVMSSIIKDKEFKKGLIL
jgi:hypothetical protein